MIADAFQRHASVGLAVGVETLPAVETAGNPRGGLRIAGVQRNDLIGQEGITVGRVEAHQIVAEGADQCVNLVWIADVERRMGGQRLDRGQRVWPAAGRLGRQPLVDDQRFVLVTGVELGQRRVAFGAVLGVDVGQRSQCGELVGHVVGGAELAERPSALGGRVEFKQVGQADVAQRTAPGFDATRRIGAGRRQGRIDGG